MREALSSDLLVRLMNATPQQYAAVEKILAAAPVEVAAPVAEDVARAAFAIVVNLDADGKAPTPITVFRLYCVDGLSADRVARKCGCGKATVIRRLRLIEQRTGRKAEDFRAMSGHLQQLDDDLNASGAREIYRRGLAKSEPDGRREVD